MVKRDTVSAQLGRHFGGNWKAERDGFGYRYVRDEDGVVVRRCWESVLGYDGYSDTEFRTVYEGSCGRYYPFIFRSTRH